MKLLTIIFITAFSAMANFTPFPSGGGGSTPSTPVDEYTEVEVEEGTYNGVTRYRRCFTVASDLVNGGVIATWATNLKILDAFTYSANLQFIWGVAAGSAYAAIVYNPDSGGIGVYTGGPYKVGAGATKCLRYIKL